MVDVCLIPEIRFDMDKLCDFVRTIMERKDYCVVCVAEGAGQDIMDSSGSKGTDASGNPILQVWLGGLDSDGGDGGLGGGV